MRSIVDTRSAIVHKPSECCPPALANPITQAQLIWITIISISIRIMRPIKDQHIVIEQQPDPSPNVTKASDIFLTPGDEDMVQHISPINKSGPQEIFSPWRK